MVIRRILLIITFCEYILIWWHSLHKLHREHSTQEWTLILRCVSVVTVFPRFSSNTAWPRPSAINCPSHHHHRRAGNGFLLLSQDSHRHGNRHKQDSTETKPTLTRPLSLFRLCPLNKDALSRHDLSNERERDIKTQRIFSLLMIRHLTDASYTDTADLDVDHVDDAKISNDFRSCSCSCFLHPLSFIRSHRKDVLTTAPASVMKPLLLASIPEVKLVNRDNSQRRSHSCTA